jgi:hypothetical protein
VQEGAFRAIAASATAARLTGINMVELGDE